ncbi:hypothetical protein MSL71_49860 [Desulfoluna butyratoxydans]|uniref:Glycosyl transferases group 1 n=2 Tax=Desulfoluna butyratoxydans TaxID=231438 RepID=A0A4U8YTK8_9BACT|nr:hypothetical protein MSL71_49860 [Desulfoluna butyratoxydans]
MPGPTGVGRVMTQLASEINQKNKTGGHSTRLLYRGQGRPVRKLFSQKQLVLALKTIMTAFWSEARFRTVTAKLPRKDTSLLIHPQTLGYEWSIEFIKNSKKPVWLYLMDSSFFCIRSYNYMAHMESACTKCIGGDLTHALNNRCSTDFGSTEGAMEFISSLKELSTRVKVRFIAQNKQQAELAKKHFGEKATVKIGGIWAADWCLEEAPAPAVTPHKYDIVFHAPPLDAKGFSWALELAEVLTERRFLFPFEKPEWVTNALPNCTFKDFRWESGLREAVTGCPLVLVPSLWSAPIEGALIKSIRLAQKTAVIRNETAYSREIPEDVLLQLTFDVKRAAEEIEVYFANRQKASPQAGKNFYDDFMQSNTRLLERLLRLTFD